MDLHASGGDDGDAACFPITLGAIFQIFQGVVWRVVSVFRPGMEYIYRYESEVLTGIRTVSDQLTGVKVRAIVKLQIHRDGSTLLKVRSHLQHTRQLSL